MKRKVVVFGHSDADGHVIAHQAHTNLSSIRTFDVQTIVDAERTKGHKSWLTIDSLSEAEEAEIVIFVDMMFSPVEFASEANSVVEWASARPEKKIFIIDHHPLPTSRLAKAANIRSVYRPIVFDCVIGPRSGLMVAAALDENQERHVSDIVGEHHKIITLGLRRAAAPGGGLTGAPLMALIRNRKWLEIHRLGLDDKKFHRLVRGRRPKNDPLSNIFKEIKTLAQELVNENDRTIKELEEVEMAYDISAEQYDSSDFPRRRRVNQKPQPTDLEAIVTLLELAALSLTEQPDSTFTKDELIDEAQNIAGNGFNFEESDADIVLEKASFLKGTKKNLSLR